MEIWKEISGYENLYEASNLGNVRSRDRRIFSKRHNGFRVFPGRILTVVTDITKKNYYNVFLSKDGKVRRITVHRLVAQLFVENPENKPCVNHKDGNKMNNNSENLQWVTHSENMKHAVATGLTPPPPLMFKTGMRKRERIKKETIG